jgi:flagellar hook-associated protein 2
MGISSLGAGSSILTQDVLDQLRAADEAKFVAPLDARLKTEKDKSAAFDVVDAYMDNVYESLKSLTEYGIFESRTASSSNENIADVVAKDSSDVQDFSLEVTDLATKEITQSGSYATKDTSIATGAGKLELTVGSETFTISYDADTSIDDLKNLINKSAGDSVNATVVQVADGDFRLLLSAVNTGTGQEIAIADVVGAGEKLGEQLVPDTGTTDGMTNVQTAIDASFKFNGVDITRSSNSIDDLLAGVTITLKDAGTTNVSVKQNTEHINERITNFVDKYNSAMLQLNTDTKSSQEVSERGIFSSDSTMKGMKASLVNMLSVVGGSAGKIEEFGLELDADGRLSLDSEKFGAKLAADPTSVQAFFVGGSFTKEDGSVIKVEGAFTEMESEVAKYSKYNNTLDQFKDSIKTRYDSITEQKEKAVERLNASYAIQAKKFAAYDLIISKFNTASDMFTQMINAEIAASK